MIESMRVSLNELGEFYFQSGDCQMSLKSYLRGKELPRTTENICELAFGLAKAAFVIKNLAYCMN